MRAWLSVLLLLLALPASAAEGKRVALVAGNSVYQFVPVLPNPSKDATAVAKALAAVGFDVTLATDRTTASLKIDVDNFIKEVEEAGPGATAVVYYAGHGVQLDGSNYILPVDAKLGKDLEATKEAVSLSDILKRLDATGATTKIVILDACRDNPFTGAWAPGLAMVENRGAGKGENGLARVEFEGRHAGVVRHRAGRHRVGRRGRPQPLHHRVPQDDAGAGRAGRAGVQARARRRL